MTTSYDPRITAYFGDAVLRAGFMPVPHTFMRHYRQLGLTAIQAMFVLQLMESTWDLGDPPRTVGDLARRMGVDPRTIRKYSEEVAGLELIRLYDQFDASGAQVENGYDLSPLFHRLAHFAPEPALSGAPRQRHERGRAAEQRGAAESRLATPGSNDPPTPGSNDLPTPGSNDPPTPDQMIRPPPDQMIRTPWRNDPPPRINRAALARIKRSGAWGSNHPGLIRNQKELKTSKNINKNHTCWLMSWELEQGRPAGRCAGSSR